MFKLVKHTGDRIVCHILFLTSRATTRFLDRHGGSASEPCSSSIAVFVLPVPAQFIKINYSIPKVSN